MRNTLLFAAATLLLAGCSGAMHKSDAAMAASTPASDAVPGNTCHADNARSHVGQLASEEIRQQARTPPVRPMSARSNPASPPPASSWPNA